MKTENDIIIIIIIIIHEVTLAHPRCERPPELDRRPPWQLGCADSKSTDRRGSGQKCDAEKPPKNELRVTRIVKGSTIPKTWNRNGSWLKLIETGNWCSRCCWVLPPAWHFLRFLLLFRCSTIGTKISVPIFFSRRPGGIRGSVHGITLIEREWSLQTLAFQLQKCGERKGRLVGKKKWFSVFLRRWSEPEKNTLRSVLLMNCEHSLVVVSHVRKTHKYLAI